MEIGQIDLTDLLLLTISVLMALSVGIQGYFLKKIWDHEGRLVKIETEHDMLYCMDGGRRKYDRVVARMASVEVEKQPGLERRVGDAGRGPGTG